MSAVGNSAWMRHLLANRGTSPQDKPEGWLFKMARSLWRLLPQPCRYQFWIWWSNVLPYQKIVYRGKVLQWGRDRTRVYRAVFPRAPVGKTILDVGCHTGFYCFMAASEGAKYCLGIDHSVSRIEKGMALIAKEGITNIELTSRRAQYFHRKGERRVRRCCLDCTLPITPL